MRFHWYAAFAVCAIVAGMTLVAYAEVNSSPVAIEVFSEELRAIEIQLISLQAIVSSQDSHPSSDGLTPAKRGDRGNAVIAIQKYLITTGDLIIDAPTSYFGPLTETAVKQLQNRERISVTGAVNKETIAAMRGRAKEDTSPPLPEPPPSVLPQSLPPVTSGPDLLRESSETNNTAGFQVTIPSMKTPPTLPPIGHWKFDGSGVNEIVGGVSAEKFDDA